MSPEKERETQRAGSPVGCAYCATYGHATASCPHAKSDRRVEKTFGCVSILVLWPFALAGFLVGMAWDALRDGFRSATGIWESSWKRMKTPQDPDEASAR